MCNLIHPSLHDMDTVHLYDIPTTFEICNFLWKMRRVPAQMECPLTFLNTIGILFRLKSFVMSNISFKMAICSNILIILLLPYSRKEIILTPLITYVLSFFAMWCIRSLQKCCLIDFIVSLIKLFFHFNVLSFWVDVCLIMSLYATKICITLI